MSFWDAVWTCVPDPKRGASFGSTDRTSTCTRMPPAFTMVVRSSLSAERSVSGEATTKRRVVQRLQTRCLVRRYGSRSIRPFEGNKSKIHQTSMHPVICSPTLPALGPEPSALAKLAGKPAGARQMRSVFLASATYL